MDPALNTAIEYEMLVHVPMFLHPDPARVLVIGEDTIGVAREVLRHPSVEKCARVAMKESETWIANAATASPIKEIFEVICVDSTSPIDPSKLKMLLSTGGILVTQAGSPLYFGKQQADLAKELKTHFKRVHFYNYVQPSEPGGLYSVAYATDSVHPIDDLSRSKVAASGLDFHYYNLGIHEAAFLLPEFQKNNLNEFLNPL